MPKVIRSARATQDLNDIWDFIAQSDIAQADKFLDLILEKCELLAQFPVMGRLRHEILLNLRTFPFKNYIIFYQQIMDGIEIVRILHGSRETDKIFDDIIDEADKLN